MKCLKRTSLPFRWGTSQRFNLLCFLLTLLALSIQFLYVGAAPLVTTLICVAGLMLALLLRWMLRPLMREIQALNLHAQNLQDGSFNTSANQLRIRELGSLAKSLQSMSAQLRAERSSLYQRELLLDTVLQSSPLGLVLTDANDTILMSNPAARQLLAAGRAMDGRKLTEAAMDAVLCDAISQKQQGLLRLPDQSVWHLSVNQFKLNHNQHWLYLFKPLTREIKREELTAWKKLLRVIGHELNNSLAPLSSLAYSGQQRAQQLDQSELSSLFQTISAQATDINKFVQAYIHFAKLPPPQMKTVKWPGLINQLHNLYEFELVGELPQRPWLADQGQLHQVLLNLLKNAHESGSAPEHIYLQIAEQSQQVEITLQDSGGGMSDQQLQHALIPFYSTKVAGSGIGLTLCRDIVEAHGGSLNLRNHSAGLEIKLLLPQA